MKKTMIVLLALAMGCSAAWGETGVISGNMLKLRKKASSKSLSLEAYPEGEKVEILGKAKNGKWLKVRVLADGMEGYVYSKYVGPEKEQYPETPDQKTVAPVAPVVGDTNPRDTDKPEENNKPQGKVVALVAKSDDSESLKQEIDRLKAESTSRAGQIFMLNKQMILVNQIPDFRLITAVEIGGESVQFNGLGTVRMAERDGRVVFRIPADLAEKAKALFGKVGSNILESSQRVIYITIDKSRLNVESGKG
ncbi:SH3 domain-containing protein [Pelobacter propionicus]|uniref:SH3, type 3 domain protein n=1 Tax=Pelobacter propionicus (strain DSM 2379 / NBRC 103807 / OttBd1) TaxID=338966 RepID=A0R7P3_PELPD|nr:SH3 domain-containing protein [Pelobacter propionicus]ABL01351.1 SH3, type 3 domain protein [Pelobacter propionicus DSM 2379]